MSVHRDFMSIGSHVFSVKSAILIADVGPVDMAWQVRIWAEGHLAESKVDPYAYSENLLPLYNRRFARWQDVLRERVSWVDCYDKEHGQMNAGLCLFVHDRIDNGLIRFNDLVGLNFGLKWTGVVDTSAAEAFEDDPEIAFLCETAMRFEGVVVRGIERDQAPSRIGEFITDQRYFYHETQGDGALLFLPG